MTTKIYTRKGDDGTTMLFGGERILKNNPFVCAYGEIDELNSSLGFLASVVDIEDVVSQVVSIQNILFEIGAILAMGSSPRIAPDTEKLLRGACLQLEKWIDKMEEELPPLRNFILPGGSMAGAWSHVCRCICRRAERRIVELAYLSVVREVILPFMNRLSDYLFVLARYINMKKNSTERRWSKQESKIADEGELL